MAGGPAGRVLVVNAGSSSVKLRLLDGDRLVAMSDLAAGDSADESLSAFVGELDRPPDAIGHRFVHGGGLAEAAVIDERIERTLREATELAPLHNAPALDWMAAAVAVAPGVPNVACLDTAFHAGLPAEAATFAVPAAWRELGPIRRFGFHGLSHAYASRRAADLLGRDLPELRLVNAHLGSGASLCAIAGGRSVDTTMGFTPLDGLVMATRSGSVDPGLILWVQRHGGLDPAAVEVALERDSGLAGLSGTSGDMRAVVAGRTAGDARCALAFDVYCHRLAAGVAAMTAALGGIDALVFTGGVGEHSADVRAEAVDRLTFLGLELDPALNRRASGDTPISAAAATAGVLVIESREDLEIATQVRNVVEG